ncbi:hypothetical protein HBB16_21010 [Pseudonocardia sp. MCCB 268]|nr:hypothetical protein [Pseudonocardia cytotoxica]
MLWHTSLRRLDMTPSRRYLFYEMAVTPADGGLAAIGRRVAAAVDRGCTARLVMERNKR